MDALIRAALEAGAAGAVVIPVSSIVLSAQFRQICEANQCGGYDRCWMCPPHLPPIEDAMAQIRRFSHALWYQSVSPLDDSFDIEGMFAAGHQHALLSQRIRDAVTPLIGENTLHLGCGGCHLCPACAKIEGKPCRLPQRAIPSLEGYGVDVYNTTKDTPLPYISGQNTVTYFGAVLFGG